MAGGQQGRLGEAHAAGRAAGTPRQRRPCWGSKRCPGGPDPAAQQRQGRMHTMGFKSCQGERPDSSS